MAAAAAVTVMGAGGRGLAAWLESDPLPLEPAAAAVAGAAGAATAGVVAAGEGAPFDDPADEEDAPAVAKAAGLTLA